MPVTFVPPVIGCRIPPEQTAHECRQTGRSAFNQNMSVVVHKRPCKNRGSRIKAHFSNSTDKIFPIVIIVNDIAFFNTPNHFRKSSGFLQRGDPAIFSSGNGRYYGLSCLQETWYQEFLRSKRRLCGIHPGGGQVFAEGRQQLGCSSPLLWCARNLWRMERSQRRRGGRDWDIRQHGSVHRRPFNTCITVFFLFSRTAFTI